LRRRGIVRADFIDSLLSHRLAEQPQLHGRMVWLLMMLEQWFGQRRGAHAPVLGCAREHAIERD
jgi:asparagine synthase (glutamine-hydrolysing)